MPSSWAPGPNGLVAALTLARAGLAVDVYEAADEPGGGCRTAELTLPGFRHDVCSAVHPLLLASPAFRDIDLSAHGVRLLTPPVAFAHPLGGPRAVAVGRRGRGRGPCPRAWTGDVRPCSSAHWSVTWTRSCRPFSAPCATLPPHPLAAAGFALRGLLSARHLAGRFQHRGGPGPRGRHGRPLHAAADRAALRRLPSALHRVGPPLRVARRRGWERRHRRMRSSPSSLHSGGGVETGRLVKRLDELPPARALVLDVTPRQLIDMAGDALPRRYGRALGPVPLRPGVCKVDWALRGPVPWSAESCRQTVTVHVGGTFEEIARSEADVNAGRHPNSPYCLVTQPCVVDPGRAPAGRHTLWAYCHVPNGSSVDMTDRIEAQIERFAPGFRDLVLARSTFTAMATEEHNPSYVGGDINAGAATLRQMIFRPTARWNPYRTALQGVYLCSAATPPGGGVHGMCGLGAARAALRDLGLPPPALP